MAPNFQTNLRVLDDRQRHPSNVITDVRFNSSTHVPGRADRLTSQKNPDSDSCDCIFLFQKFCWASGDDDDEWWTVSWQTTSSKPPCRLMTIHLKPLLGAGEHAVYLVTYLYSLDGLVSQSAWSAPRFSLSFVSSWAQCGLVCWQTTATFYKETILQNAGSRLYTLSECHWFLVCTVCFSRCFSIASEEKTKSQSGVKTTWNHHQKVLIEMKNSNCGHKHYEHQPDLFYDTHVACSDQKIDSTHAADSTFMPGLLLFRLFQQDEHRMWYLNFIIHTIASRG